MDFFKEFQQQGSFIFCKKHLGIFLVGLTIGIFSREIDLSSKIFSQESYPNELITNIYDNRLPFLPYAVPTIFRSGYTLGYDPRNRNPQWVYEHLTPQSISGKADRKNCQFQEDTSIPIIFRSTLADYKGSGFDRGHLAPAADHKSSDECMADTFYLSNICPQCPSMNRGIWNKLENYVRDLTKSSQNVYVITGPLYMPYSEKDGNRYVKYRVIGPNDVAVPTHYFKVIRIEKKSGTFETQAYILPNEEIAPSTPLDKFKATVESIEKIAGIILTNSS